MQMSFRITNIFFNFISWKIKIFFKRQLRVFLIWTVSFLTREEITFFSFAKVSPFAASDIWHETRTCFSILLATSNKVGRMNMLSLLIRIWYPWCKSSNCENSAHSERWNKHHMIVVRKTFFPSYKRLLFAPEFSENIWPTETWILLLFLRIIDIIRRDLIN